jgi:hypothetical protein
MSKEIGAEAALEDCRTLTDRINTALSAEKPFVNVSSTAELLLYLSLPLRRVSFLISNSMERCGGAVRQLMRPISEVS